MYDTYGFKIAQLVQMEYNPIVTITPSPAVSALLNRIFLSWQKEYLNATLSNPLSLNCKCHSVTKAFHKGSNYKQLQYCTCI